MSYFQQQRKNKIENELKRWEDLVKLFPELKQDPFKHNYAHIKTNIDRLSVKMCNKAIKDLAEMTERTKVDRLNKMLYSKEFIAYSNTKSVYSKELKATATKVVQEMKDILADDREYHKRAKELKIMFQEAKKKTTKERLMTVESIMKQLQPLVERNRLMANEFYLIRSIAHTRGYRNDANP